VDNKAKLDRNEMNMFRRMCGLNMKDSKKNLENYRELLGLEPVSLSISRSRLLWSGHVERKHDADWVK